jgi:hypothetical protein
MDQFKFEMKGRAFEDGDRLDKVVAGLSGIQHFFDGTFKAITDRSRVSKRDREFYHVVIREYHDGSFIAYLGMVLTGIQPVLPFVSNIATPDNVWAATHQAFEFIKKLYSLARNNQEYSIQQDGDHNAAIVHGDQKYIYNGPVIHIGKIIIGSLRELDDVLEGDEVDSIRLEGPTKESLELLVEDKGQFYPPVTVREEPINIRCDVFDFNKYENIGRAAVPVNEGIPQGNYKFRNIGSQDVEEFILSMTETSVKIRCLIKFEHDPLAEKKISELLVLSIAA